MNLKLTWKIWVLIVALMLSLLAIKPTFQSGVVIKYVDPNSDIFKEGIRAGEIIKSIDGKTINNKADYANAVGNINFNSSDVILVITTDKNSYDFLTNQSLSISVDNIPKTRIQTGLDLRGGARALVQPNITITDAQLSDLILISRNRLNVYGLSDVQIRGATDLSGDKFMIVEIAGATPGDLETLLSQQGKFEAKVGNISVFKGEKNDISDVCRNDAKCSGIRACSPTTGGYTCQFTFAVYLTPEAAKRHAEVTKNMSLDETGKYLSEKLYLFVDDKEVDSLLIGVDLRGRETTEISIQGPGVGRTQTEAYDDAKENMNKLQTILKTGSLPYKLNIVKLDTISPTLGYEFIYWILIAGASSIILVGFIVLLRYRKIKASIAILFTSFSEIVIILGVASLIKWNLDLPSIAGILATIGTGVDQQIIILDEARTHSNLSIKEKMKRALFIIFSAFFTSAVSLLPLFSAGAGLFKGFAITTLIGITAGVFITRPAFADIIKKIEG